MTQASGQAGKSGQLAAFIQQRIRHVDRRQWPTPLPSRTAQSRKRSSESMVSMSRTREALVLLPVRPVVRR